MEKKTIVIGKVVDGISEKAPSISERILQDISSETVLQPNQIVTRSMGVLVMNIGVHWVRSRVGIRKKRCVKKFVFLTKPKYSKRSRLSNFWPKMPRSLDLGDLLRYHLERTNHE